MNETPLPNQEPSSTDRVENLLFGLLLFILCATLSAYGTIRATSNHIAENDPIRGVIVLGAILAGCATMLGIRTFVKYYWQQKPRTKWGATVTIITAINLSVLYLGAYFFAVDVLLPHPNRQLTLMEALIDATDITVLAKDGRPFKPTSREEYALWTAHLSQFYVLTKGTDEKTRLFYCTRTGGSFQYFEDEEYLPFIEQILKNWKVEEKPPAQA